MKSIRLLTAILVFVTSYVSCLAEADMQSKASETQQSLQQQSLRITRSAEQEEGQKRASNLAKDVRKRAAFKFEKRDAPSFAADESGNDVGNVHSIAKRAAQQQWRGVPWFLAKRSAGADDQAEFEEEGFQGNWDDESAAKRGRPRFIGKRDDADMDEDADIKRGRPRFIGKRFFVDADEDADVKRGRPRFIGRRSQSKRGRPRFIGRRSNNDARIAELISALSRDAELERARQRIANAKRRYAPRFIGKRSLEQGDEQGSRR